MRTFLTDEDNDFMQDDAGNLVIAEGLVGEAQETRHFAATARGEMIHYVDRGVPFLPLAFSPVPPTIPQFEAAIRARLSQAPDVIEVLTVTARQVSDTLVYTATIRTTSGVAEING
jgi:hypothetical protein